MAEPDTEPSARDAADVVARYYALVGRGAYRQARALWRDGARASGMSAQAFAASFARYAIYRAEVGTPGRIDAGAGQRYVSVPVRVVGTLRDGRPFAMPGTVLLRRTGNIDGATAEDRQWRIHSIDTKEAEEAQTAERQDRPRIVRYRCVDGSRITVLFDAANDEAEIERDRKRLVRLQGQRPASGIWYAGDGYALRGKGADATLTMPDMPPLPCRAVNWP